MKTSLEAQFNLSREPVVIGKVMMAMTQVALLISLEVFDDKRPIRYKKRQDLAVKCLNDPDYWARRFVQAGIALDQSTGYGTDDLIIGAITKVFDPLAGVLSID